MLAVHILTYHDGEVYLHHGWMIVYIILFAAFISSASSTSTSGIERILKEIRDELKKRNG